MLWMLWWYSHTSIRIDNASHAMVHLCVQDHGLFWYEMSLYGLVLLLCLILLWILEFGFVWFGIAWYDMAWYGLVLLVSLILLWIPELVWFGLVLPLCLILLWIPEFGFAWFGIAWFGIAWVGIAWYDMAWYGLVLPGIIWPGMVKEPRAALNSTSSRRKRWLNLFKKGVKSICTLLPSSAPFVANFQKYLCQTNWDTAQKRQRTCLTFLHFVVFGK